MKGLECTCGCGCIDPVNRDEYECDRCLSGDHNEPVEDEEDE